MSKNADTGKKKKALLVTRVSGFIPQFEMNNVKILQEMGYEAVSYTHLKTYQHSPKFKGLVVHSPESFRL